MSILHLIILIVVVELAKASEHCDYYVNIEDRSGMSETLYMLLVTTVPAIMILLIFLLVMTAVTLYFYFGEFDVVYEAFSPPIS